MYYGLNGQPISDEEWSEVFRSRERFLGRDLISVAEGWEVELSTVWIGISWGAEEKPLIFETMAFEKGSFDDIGCWRWATREEAVAGHQRLVSEIVSGELQLARATYSEDEVF
jgi:hypothetical protein